MDFSEIFYRRRAPNVDDEKEKNKRGAAAKRKNSQDSCVHINNNYCYQFTHHRTLI